MILRVFPTSTLTYWVGYTVQKVVYTRTAAGPAISYNYRVKVTKKNYKLYKNFKWKKSKTKVYKKTYVAKYRYDHKNGNKYLALYTKGGNSYCLDNIQKILVM